MSPRKEASSFDLCCLFILQFDGFSDTIWYLFIVSENGFNEVCEVVI